MRPTLDTPAMARLADLAVIAALTAAWVACVALVDPVGDFPLNDDWSYGTSVLTLVETGSFRLGDWVSMPLVVQVLWGALFCRPDGFSFTALRVSTLVLGCAGVLSTYGLLRVGRARRRYAALGALLLAANPIYFQLSHTFMTDVPFAAVALTAALLLLYGVEHDSRRAVAAGTAAAVAATLIRQVGLVVPAAFAAAYLVRHGGGWRRVAAAAVPLLLAAAALLAYNAWLASHQTLPALYHVQVTELSAALRHPLRTAGSGVVRLFKSVWWLGLFSLPLALCASGPLPNGTSRWPRAVGAVVLVAFVLPAVWWTARGWLLPNIRNTLTDHGVGPILLRDVGDHPERLSPLPRWFWLLVTIAATAGGGLLLWRTSAAVRTIAGARTDAGPRRGRSAAVFGLTVLACYLPPIHAIEPFDRYLVLALPFWWLAFAGTGAFAGTRAVAPEPTRFPRYRGVAALVGVLLLLGYASYAVAATHDYLALNRARWQLLNGLVAPGVGVPVSAVDGGFEFNSLYRLGDRTDPAPGRPEHWFREHEYAVTLGPMVGYAVVADEAFDRWLPPSRQTFYLLKRGP